MKTTNNEYFEKVKASGNYIPYKKLVAFMKKECESCEFKNNCKPENCKHKDALKNEFKRNFDFVNLFAKYHDECGKISESVHKHMIEITALTESVNDRIWRSSL